MIAYNVTIKIDLSVHDEWLTYMKDEHIPDVISTNMFVDYNMFRLLEQNETDGITYSIQYFCQTMDDYFRYQKEFAPKLQAEHKEKFQGKFVAFRTLMRAID